MLKRKDGIVMQVEDAANYLYNMEFGSIEARFDALTMGDSLPADFVTILGGVSGDKWVASGTADYSLDGATITYIGDNSSDLRSCSWFKKVVIVQLSEKCRMLNGALCFHLHRI